MPGGIHPPLEVILSWPTPNYDHPVAKPRAITIIACIFGPLTLFLLLARLWVRLRIQHKAGWDDWLMVAAIVPIIAVTVLLALITDVYHFNKHVWDVQPQFYITQRKYIMAIDSIFCLASGLIKISILLFYRRLSSRAISKNFRRATRVTVGFIAAYTIAFMIVPIFGCNPISAFWNQLDFVLVVKGYSYKCFNEGADVFAAGVISTTQDFLTAMLPTFLYWNLKIPIRQKIALFGIFAIGYGAVAFGALRSYYSWQVYFETYDVTWVGWYICLWSLLELHIGAMCANAPALKVFFKHFLRLERFSTSSKSGSNGSKSKNGSAAAFSSFRSASAFEKLAFWKTSHSHSNDGYLSEPHTDISVDQHGGVQVQKEVYISRAPISEHNSIDMLGTHVDDIEMGSFDAGSHSGRSTLISQEDVEALPRVPPQSRRAGNEGSARLPRKSKKPAWQSWT